MRIIIDMQGAQSGSKYRGIGRYSSSLVNAIVKQAYSHEVWLVLNSSFPNSVLEIKASMKGLVPDNRIKVFDTCIAAAHINANYEFFAPVSEKIREYFINELDPDMVLITSLFEGYNVITSIDGFFQKENTATILYDLIPYIHPLDYLRTPLQKEYYYRKLEYLKKANLLFSISEYSKQTAIQYLGISPDKIINILSGVDSSFKPLALNEIDKIAFRKRFCLAKEIILSVSGGMDTRKNIKGLIQAFSLLLAKLRANYQLVLIGNITLEEKHFLNALSAKLGIAENEIIITGYISNDDLIIFYNIATLFVFPSKEEGFGLPVLEAMACGVPVIGSNTSSIPEVINYDDALFDPFSPSSIADKIEQVLTNELFQNRLRKNGLEQAKNFTWDKSAEKLLRGLENYHASIQANAEKNPISLNFLKTNKPRLAVISPLPPEKTGVADYCADLIRLLIDYYEIELITEQKNIELPNHLCSKLKQRTLNWFKLNSNYYDRVIYQIGNSPFHSDMFAMLQQYPGLVVLHDFYLSAMLAYEELTKRMPFIWAKTLYDSHGYCALLDRFTSKDLEQVKEYYPCNLPVLQSAKGIIAHSKYAQSLAQNWYANDTTENWFTIPLLRKLPKKIERVNARKLLGISDNVFLVCSFGFLDSAKLNHILLDAWLKSQLSHHKECKLVFVGENHGGEYGQQLIHAINQRDSENAISITGWASSNVYELYLQAADVSVQLRSSSRGETSGAILDAMSYGLAVIINANGSAAEYPRDAAWKLPDQFEQAELTLALETLYANVEKRKQLGNGARDFVLEKHDPTLIAMQYIRAIEFSYCRNKYDSHALLKSIVKTEGLPSDKRYHKYIAHVVARVSQKKPSQKQLLIDITSIIKNDLKTGIERVVRAQLLEFIKNPPKYYRVEPVYLKKVNGCWNCYYAREFAFKFLGIPCIGLSDNPIDIYQGDIYYALDFLPYEIVQASKAGLFTRWRVLGAKLNILVYDILPILHPEFFPKGVAEAHAIWLEEICNIADRLIAISTAVASDLRAWIKQHKLTNADNFNQAIEICSVPLGADIAASVPTKGLPDSSMEFLMQMRQSKSFLMVGTIEPRKGYAQVLAAFEFLWQHGHQVQLIIIGKEGWKHLNMEERSVISKIVNKIAKHTELNKRLFWFEHTSDEYLQAIYAAATCLINASEGEGFGLPIIEAAYYNLPIITRDLHVFREIAQQNAFYFAGLAGEDLVNAIIKWLDLHATGNVPSSDKITYLTWEENVRQLSAILTDISSEQSCSKVKTHNMTLEA